MSEGMVKKYQELQDRKKYYFFFKKGFLKKKNRNPMRGENKKSNRIHL